MKIAKAASKARRPTMNPAAIKTDLHYIQIEQLPHIEIE